MQVIPAVDVLGGNAVRLAQGDYDQVTRYADDPIEMVQQWADAGADLVHVVDLEGARSGISNRGLVERLGAVGVPIQFGGGIRTVESAEAALGGGLSRIVVGSVLLGDGAADFVSAPRCRIDRRRRRCAVGSSARERVGGSTASRPTRHCNGCSTSDSPPFWPPASRPTA